MLWLPVSVASTALYVILLTLYCVPGLFCVSVTVAALSYASARLSQPPVLYLDLSDGPAVEVEIAQRLSRR